MTIYIIVAAIAVGLSLYLLIKIPETATLLVVFIIYTNLPAVLSNAFDLPDLVVGSFILLLFLPLTVYIAFRRDKLIVDRVLILLFGFLIILLASSLFAIDTQIALLWVVGFVLEGLILYFLIINVVRTQETLKRTIWVLLLAGGLLGSLTLYQDITHSYSNEFGGLARRARQDGGDEEFESSDSGLRNRMETTSYNRAGGPFKGPNRFGQIMVVLMPFGLFMFWMQRRWSLKLTAGLLLLLITSGALLTYSRGAFVGMAMVLIFMTFMRYIRIHQFIGVLVLLLALMVVASPGYFSRLQSLRGIEGLFSQEASYRPDSTTRGRTTEMLAALLAFIDHPLLGVGPGQYTPFYSVKYQLNKSIAFRHIPKTRRSHTLYFELAAETGVFGLLIFLAIVLSIMWQLSKLRQQEGNINSEKSYIASAFLLSIAGYLFTAIFLHLSYQRYLWLILGLSSAAVHVLNAKKDEDSDSDGTLPQ